MKNKIRIFSVYAIVSIALFGCNKTTNHLSMTEEQMLSATDIHATIEMNTTLSLMQHDMDSIQATPNHSKQHHWDSIYHCHDSIFWHHHGNYSHKNMHDDHTHSYIPYHHYTGYHHCYPGHESDSMIIHAGTHHHDSTNYHHHHGHDMEHHHAIDSLEKIHHKYH